MLEPWCKTLLFHHLQIYLIYSSIWEAHLFVENHEASKPAKEQQKTDVKPFGTW